jgi:predicted phage terminase large subunit-like protein
MAIDFSREADGIAKRIFREVRAAENPSAAPSFLEFCRRTLPHALDPWQEDLCRRLEPLKDNKRMRLMVHAIPQGGKSVIVAQRLPAWLLGCNPTWRIKLACYNIQRAEQHGKALLSVMRSEAFNLMFPHVIVPAQLQVGRWSTDQRSRIADGQPSFAALGLSTGFVGEGCDVLLMDDPYASAADAYSKSTQDQVWTFWTDDAKPRLHDASVVLMYHRWVDDDLAGRLMEQEKDAWTELRYAGICDDPVTDPIGRPLGEPLCQRLADYIREAEQGSASTFASLFQGRPMPIGGGMLKRDWFKIVGPDDVPPPQDLYDLNKVEKVVRWAIGADLATSEKKSADYTVAFAGCVTNRNNYYILKPYRERAEWPMAKRGIAALAEDHGIRRIEMDARGPQKGLVADFRETYPLSVTEFKAPGDKVAKAYIWSDVAAQGRVHLVEDGSGWTAEFLREIELFPRGKHDDQVDALGILLHALWAKSSPYGAKIKVGSVVYKFSA